MNRSVRHYSAGFERGTYRINRPIWVRCSVSDGQLLFRHPWAIDVNRSFKLLFLFIGEWLWIINYFDWIEMKEGVQRHLTERKQTELQWTKKDVQKRIWSFIWVLTSYLRSLFNFREEIQIFFLQFSSIWLERIDFCWRSAATVWHYIHIKNSLLLLMRKNFIWLVTTWHRNISYNRGRSIIGWVAGSLARESSAWSLF